MKRKVVSLLLCAALVTQSTAPVWAEDLLSSGEAEILDSVTLDDGTGVAAEPGITDSEVQEENQGTEINPEEEKPQEEAGERNIIDSGTCGEKVTWTLDDTGLLIISGEGEMEDYSWKDSLFYGNTNIKSVVIEDGVTNIGTYLFENCVRLTEITIPNSVTSIGESAFSSCDNLENIVLPDSIVVIGGSAFSHCSSLTSISIPESVTTIGPGAFEYCSSLVNINIPNGVTHIRENTFRVCSNLVSVDISESVVEIGDYAFWACNGLKNIDIPNSVTSIGSGAFQNCHFLTNISIPDSVTEIGSGAFAQCYNLKNIVLPANLTEINEALFSGGNSLTSVVIPDKVTDIGNAAFSDCRSLKSVTIPPSVAFIGTTAFDNSNNVTIWGERTSYAETYANKKGIPFRVIGEDANSGTCGENLTWVLDDNGCLKISGTGAMFEYSDSKQSPFYGNADIKTVEIGEGVTSIGDFAFANCSNLERITIPNSVTAIGEQAFINVDKVSIQAHIDSYAKEYAEKEKIPFKALKDEVHTHSWDNGKITKYPTCTSTGTRTYTCTSCGATKTTTIAATGHSWNSGTVTKKPTCTEKGIKTYKCKDCGATRTESIPELEHKVKGKIVKATFTKDGSISGVCELCGEKVENKVINCVPNIELSQSEYVYNGTERRPEVILKDSKGKKVSPSDYTVAYPAESKNPGTYTFTITLKGDYYEGTATRDYTVVKANQTVKLDDAVKRIDSKTVTLKAQITQGNKSGKFTYTSDNPEVASVTSWGKVTFHKVGRVNITATTKGNGNYNGASKTMTLTVIPASTAITKLQSQKPGWLNIQYRANRDADGYQIQYGISPDMKNAKYVAVKDSAIRSYTRKDVKSGETYFVRVRTFNVVDGERIYSNWSGIKSMTVK